MGMFSFIEKGLGLITGATSAAKAAKKAGEVSLEEQAALKMEMSDIYQPRIGIGGEAFQGLSDFYSGDQQAIIDQAKSSPFMSSLVAAGEGAIARNAQATGGFRSGTTQENLAENSQNVLMGLVSQILQGKQGIAQAGFGAEDALYNCNAEYNCRSRGYAWRNCKYRHKSSGRKAKYSWWVGWWVG